ncbi:MAG: leucine-rich repeat protein, partial [Clostridia bacterium]|nr:leucine-rich repeat protein [Clostridia bacterium]
KVIEDGAFALCDILKSITIPASVNSIGEMAFGYGKWSVAVEGFTVKGYRNSPAYDYATANGFEFVSLGFITSGTCGEDVSWEYNEETKVLSFSGTGAMEDFSKDAPARFSPIPYESVEIAETITRIGAYAFYNSLVTDFELSDSITEIGEKAIGYYTDENGEDAVDIIVSVTAYEDTAAHAYALANDIAFVSLGKKLVTQGSLGESVIWNYDEETKTLTISGTGKTYKYSLAEPAAFADYEIESVIVEDGVTAIGDYALYTAVPYNKISLGKDIMNIGKYAFGFVQTEILDEEMNPTGEYELTGNAQLEVTGYIATPADEYARAFGFTFIPLDADTYQDFRLGASSTVDHVNRYIYLYVKAPDAEQVFGTIDTEKFEAVLPEKIATGATLSLTDAIGTVDYSIVMYGDINLDGNTNSIDALTILMNSVGLIGFDNDCQPLASDINHDGKINSIDALIILQLNVEMMEIEDMYNPGIVG